MIGMLEGLPAPEARLWPLLEAVCPAEAAAIHGEGVLLGHGSAGCWVQRNDAGEETSLLLRNTAGGVTLAALPGADAAELAQFLRVAGWSSLTLPEGWAERLALPHTGREDCLVMRWTQEQAALPYGFALRPINAAQLLQNTLAAFGEVIPREEREEWQWAFALRLRRGTALAMGLWQRQQLLAAAALSHVGRTAALIGFVGIPPEHRGLGHGRCLAAAMAALAKERGLLPLLCCRPELEELYRSAGFAAAGRQTLLRPE